MVYLGMQESSGKDISFIGINESEPEMMVRKACQRALDENVANLQKNFDVFKIKAPLLSLQPLTCEIGKKEGVTEDSRFEVLEVVEDNKGHIEYKRAGIIRPVKDKIWDNRFYGSLAFFYHSHFGSSVSSILVLCIQTWCFFKKKFILVDEFNIQRTFLEYIDDFLLIRYENTLYSACFIAVIILCFRSIWNAIIITFH